jgi:DNA-binding transcriptional regulator YdaS (Cro superfamily)
MKLSEYLSNRGAQSDLAKSMGVSPVLIHQWASELRQVPFERCMPIEIATGGAVTRKDLRPDDWHIHWPELVEKAA